LDLTLSPLTSLTLSLSHSLTLSLSFSHSLILSLSFSHSLILSFSLLLSFSHSLILSFSHSLILSFSHSLILSFSHSLILSVSHSLILSFSHSLILSFSHSLILSFSHSLILIPSFSHSLILSFSLSLSHSHVLGEKNAWKNVASFVDSRDAVYDVKFAPTHLGLKVCRTHFLLSITFSQNKISHQIQKVATCSGDGYIRIYEAADVMNLSAWSLVHEFEVSKSSKSIIRMSWNANQFDPVAVVVASTGAGETTKVYLIFFFLLCICCFVFILFYFCFYFVLFLICFVFALFLF
jgi:hypothetical protein